MSDSALEIDNSDLDLANITSLPQVALTLRWALDFN